MRAVYHLPHIAGGLPLGKPGSLYKRQCSDKAMACGDTGAWHGRGRRHVWVGADVHWDGGGDFRGDGGLTLFLTLGHLLPLPTRWAPVWEIFRVNICCSRGGVRGCWEEASVGVGVGWESPVLRSCGHQVYPKDSCGLLGERPWHFSLTRSNMR